MFESRSLTLASSAQLGETGCLGLTKAILDGAAAGFDLF
jgi:hypothetical protein